jgi:hypothetical protein
MTFSSPQETRLFIYNLGCSDFDSASSLIAGCSPPAVCPHCASGQPPQHLPSLLPQLILKGE